MNSPRIQLRDKIVALVKEMADFSEDNVTLYKLDRVDKTPSASVYLGRMDSELSTMGDDSNSYDREIVIMVDFHSDHGADADAQTDGWLGELETLIYQAQGEGVLPDCIEDIELDYAEFRPTSTGKEALGDLVTVWRAEFNETLSLS